MPQLTSDLQIFENIPFKTRSTCAVCESSFKQKTLELPKFPLTEVYTKNKPDKLVGFLDQYFYYCENCGHGQLGRIIDPKILYGLKSYFFRTSESASAQKANDVFLKFIDKVIKNRKFDTIVEIGSSDLYLLFKLQNKGKKLYGIDPILAGFEKKLSKKNITAIGDFYENIDFGQLIGGKDCLILTSHTLEHVSDPKKMLKNLFSYASNESIFIFQFPGFDTLVGEGRYDQIFHQHLHYFSLFSFCWLLSELGGELLNYEITYKHWGTLMVAFRKSSKMDPRVKPEDDRLRKSFNKYSSHQVQQGYEKFKIKMKKISDYLISLKKDKIYGFGAALMLPVLGYYLNTDFSEFVSILDDDKSKEGLYYINLRAAIRRPTMKDKFEDSVMVVTAMDATRPILKRVMALQPRRIVVVNEIF